MRKSSYVFIIACLCVAIGALGSYSIFLNYFGQGHELHARIQSLEKKFKEEQFKNSLLSYQLQDLQQTVAVVFPEDKALLAKLNEQGRGLASALRVPASERKMDLSGVVFERAKKAFQQRKFDDAIKGFQGLINEYPLSGYSVQSRFFLVESYYSKKDFKSCLTAVEEMLELYPEHELTGFAMLRMALISEANGQVEEAGEISKVILKNFDHPQLIEMAKKITAEAELSL